MPVFRSRRRRVVPAALGVMTVVAVGCAQQGPPQGLQQTNKPISVHACTPPGPLIPGNTNDRCGGMVVDSFTSMLVRYDNSGHIHNDLAQTITTDDNRRFRIIVREGATFHDGTPVTASSFVDAWNFTAYAPNQQVNAPFFSPVEGYEDVHPRDGSTPTANTMSGLKVTGERTFEVTLTHARPRVTERLGHRAFAPLPDVFFSDRDRFAASPVGAGPFRVAENTDSLVRLERFPQYVGSAPAGSDTLELRYYGNSRDALKDLQSGLLDVSADLPNAAVRPEALETAFGARHARVVTGTVTTLDFATPDADPSVQNTDLRHAISLAIDRDRIAREQFPGTRVPANGWVAPMVPEGSPGGCGDFCTYDPERARALLEKAGGYSGQLTLWHNADSDHEQWTTAVCRSIRTTIDVNCVSTPVLDQATLRAKASAGTLTGLHRSAWSMNHPSPDNYLAPLYSTGGSANDGLYSNPAFDALLARAEAETSSTERRKVYHLAERVLAEDMPTIPMFNHINVAAWSPRVADVVLTYSGLVDLGSLRLADAVADAPGT